MLNVQPRCTTVIDSSKVTAVYVGTENPKERDDVIDTKVGLKIGMRLGASRYTACKPGVPSWEVGCVRRYS